MPETVKLGSTGPDVALCQERLSAHGIACTADGSFGPNTDARVRSFQAGKGLSVDGVVGPGTWRALLDQPIARKLADWADFVPLLGPAMSARYSLTKAQVPKFPPGVTFLPSRFLGVERCNCSMFTAYLLGNGFGGPFTKDQWLEWQVAKGSNESVYRGYGPWVVSQWNVGTLAGRVVPRDGVYLVQSFSTWPKGHSWLVLDYDEATDKILTLESNTKGFGLDGIGFGGLGPIRSTNAVDWVHRTKMTWSGRTKSYSQVHMAKLDIDHSSVRNWLG